MKAKRLVAMGALIITFLMITLTLPLASAQVSSFQVTIPFPFVVGNQTLPAGTYMVQRFLGKPKSPADVRVIVMKANDKHVYKVLVTGSREESRAAGAAGSRLIFTSLGGREYLSRICVAGDVVVHQLANVPSEVSVQDASREVIVTGTRSGEAK
jgi:hypothetical protein